MPKSIHWTRLSTLTAIALGLATVQAAAEAECAADVRKLMQGDLAWDTPIKSRSVTTMGEQEMVNLGLTDGKHHLTMDAQGTPVSLFTENKFYTTADKGASWTLVQTYTPEVMAETKAGLASQAEKATNITCDYGLDLDGRRVNHYGVDYALHNTGTPMRSEYWVDAETGFAWKALTISDPGGNEITIVQSSEPAPGETVPQPQD